MSRESRQIRKAQKAAAKAEAEARRAAARAQAAAATAAAKAGAYTPQYQPGQQYGAPQYQTPQYAARPAPQWEVPVWIPPDPKPQRPPLVRATSSSADMPTPWLAGVCSGLSVHLGLPVWAIRLIFAFLGVLVGTGLVLYLWLVVTVPLDDGSAESDGRLASPQTRLAEDRARVTARNQILIAGIGVLMVALIAYLAFRSDALRVRDFIGIPLILVGLVLVWAQGSRVRQWKSPLVLSSIAGGLIMMSAGVIMLVSRSDSPQVLMRGGALGALVVLGIGIALAPLWIRFNREYTAAAENTVREQERAEIGAHLHDSVLQTLTLIRSAADDPARVRALALTQERELRSWLYTGHEEAVDSLAQAMRDAIGAVESTYGQAIDVVTVGDRRPSGPELALVAAAAEAATNAMRHAAPPVSVYVEVTPDGIDAYVKDSGTGFDPDSIPEDRHGVRNSIYGRMERAGGTATIRPRETGTEVHLHLPAAALDNETMAPNQTDTLAED